MRAVRRAMLAGRRVADCSHCYLVERNGGASRRQNANVRWVAELGPRLDALLEESRLHDGALTSLPLYYQLIPGNLCNLKCRMCKPEFSRQIERDPVHRRWAPPGPTPALAGPLARWTNGRVTLVPDTPCDVAVNGFYAPEVVRGRPLVWTGGRAGVTIQVPPGVRPEALRLRVRSYHPRGTRLQVRANGAVAFEGVVPRWSGPLPRRGWEHTLALPDVARDRRLSIELRSSTFRPEGTRDLGIPIDLLELIYSGAPQATPASRLPEGPWYRDDAWIREVLLQNAADLRGLYFTGGEPMIEKQVENILRWLIDRNFAGNVALEMNTNCTIVREPMLEMLRGFRHVVLALSIDACGPVYESIRFPAKWAAVAQNAQRLAAMAGPRFQPMGGIALQVFNLLHLVEVAEFFDGLGLPFHVELVTSPSFLVAL